MKLSDKPATRPEPVRPIQSGGKRGQKIILYGTGGIGKTTLCSLLPDVGIRPLFFDLDDETSFVSVDRIGPFLEDGRRLDWESLLTMLADPTAFGEYDALVFDNLTKAEQLASEWVVANVQHEKGSSVQINRIEDYGFGKGFSHIYHEFQRLLTLLDVLAFSGKHVFGICHECTVIVNNPVGDDYSRFEPRLHDGTSGKASIRKRIKEWCHHLLFLGYDIDVSKQGKAKGTGSVTIYTSELPYCMAKSRFLEPRPVRFLKGDSTIWNLIFEREVNA